MKDKIVVIAGPTAVGKTDISIEIAKALNGEIISCDSMQIYKYMNIGTAKPTKDEMQGIPHHLMDFADPRESFTVADYQKLATEKIIQLTASGKMPIIVGGTGLYLNSLLFPMDFAKSGENAAYRDELYRIEREQGREKLHLMLEETDPDAAERIHPNNVKKVIRALERLEAGEASVKPFKKAADEEYLYDAELICLTRNREELYSRINKRVDIMISQGLEDEVRGLMEMGLDSSFISMNGIGYKEMLEYINGECSYKDAVDKIKKNSRHYAKRQLTWFKRYGKMKWYNLSEYLSDSQAVEVIIECLTKRK